MARSYAYKPRFRDIRIRPPGEEPKPEERTCDWAGCHGKGSCRAPMGPSQLAEFYWFCPSHAAQYNKNWNFFADMNEAELAEAQAAMAHGNRPTWSMNAGARGRARAGSASAAKAAMPGQGAGSSAWRGAFFDVHSVFGAASARTGAPQEAIQKRRLGRLERRALDTLGLAADAAGDAVRARYAELVKRFHPDANGGDRSSEGRLQEVVRAYQTLKKAGYA